MTTLPHPVVEVRLEKLDETLPPWDGLGRGRAPPPWGTQEAFLSSMSIR